MGRRGMGSGEGVRQTLAVSGCFIRRGRNSRNGRIFLEQGAKLSERSEFFCALFRPGIAGHFVEFPAPDNAAGNGQCLPHAFPAAHATPAHCRCPSPPAALSGLSPSNPPIYKKSDRHETFHPRGSSNAAKRKRRHIIMIDKKRGMCAKAHREVST